MPSVFHSRSTRASSTWNIKSHLSYFASLQRVRIPLDACKSGEGGKTVQQWWKHESPPKIYWSFRALIDVIYGQLWRSQRKGKNYKFNFRIKITAARKIPSAVRFSLDILRQFCVSYFFALSPQSFYSPKRKGKTSESFTKEKNSRKIIDFPFSSKSIPGLRAGMKTFGSFFFR